MERITNNLNEITGKLNNSNSLWNLLSDTVITQDLKFAVKGFRQAGSNTADLTHQVKSMVAQYEKGNGLANSLFVDTALSAKLNYSLGKIQQASVKTSLMIENLESVILKLKAGEGTAGLVLADTALRNKLVRSAISIEQGTSKFNENMEAMRTNFLFKGYFKNLEKEEKKKKSN